jgi:hypothetical protein
LNSSAGGDHGNPVKVKLRQFNDAGTYPGNISFSDPAALTTTFRVPDDAKAGANDQPDTPAYEVSASGCDGAVITSNRAREGRGFCFSCLMDTWKQACNDGWRSINMHHINKYVLGLAWMV